MYRSCINSSEGKPAVGLLLASLLDGHECRPGASVWWCAKQTDPICMGHFAVHPQQQVFEQVFAPKSIARLVEFLRLRQTVRTDGRKKSPGPSLRSAQVPLSGTSLPPLAPCPTDNRLLWPCFRTAVLPQRLHVARGNRGERTGGTGSIPARSTRKPIW